MAATMNAGSCLHSKSNCSAPISNSKAGTQFSSLPLHRRSRCTWFPTGVGIRINGGGDGRGWRNGRFYTEKEGYVGGGRSSVPTISAIANPQDSKATVLRKILESPGIHLGPACFNALSAKLVERAGFNFGFTTGFGISAAKLGLPDVGLISYGEMVAQGQEITEAVSIPLIGDGDNGYGNAMNVKRTVKGYIRAGYAGILLEDQVCIVIKLM